MAATGNQTPNNATADTASDPTIQQKSVSLWQDAVYRLTRNPVAMISLGALVIIILMAIFGPYMVKYNYYSNDLMNTNKAPSGEHWFGTDNLGRDMWVRTWMGARISLIVGFSAALIDLLIGIIYGAIMGYKGGRVDEVMNKISEILYSIPYLLIVILLLVVMEPGLPTIIFALAVTGWVTMSWIVRGEIMQLKNRDFILAARSMGASGSRQLFKHLLPNALGPIIVTVTLSVPSAIFSEAFLSFLGLGVQAPVSSLGSMINDALQGWNLYPWRMWFPAGLICITMLAFNLLGDGLRDALDPKLRK
ncbi:ABC transporter permease [Paenibacillus bovis]|uniref:Diguanylate cyclase n=1 Tax=Paenibacillus bovis TaxID=1616788 RepID=A0A172ZJI1_9BACL|nr:ABC transporter permease [Paenibacillus bovis]ANF97703.1 diguanylate cyclase [Paenibacillus bovis]